MKSLAARPAAARRAAAAPRSRRTTSDHAEGGEDHSHQARRTARRPADTAKAMAQAERTAIQSDLAWVGVYNGAINGEVSERMINAIKAYQKDIGAKQTGVLNPQERDDARRRREEAAERRRLEDRRRSRQRHPAWRSDQARAADELDRQVTGSKWSSAQGQIQIETWRLQSRQRSQPSPSARRTSRPGARSTTAWCGRDFFVLSGLQGLKKFYVRGQISGDEVRGMTILYDQATEGTMAPVVIAMSSAFTPFPARHRRRRPRRRRARRWSMRPASSSAPTARSSPIVRPSTAASSSSCRATATPTASPRTRRATWRCCASTARAI